MASQLAPTPRRFSFIVSVAVGSGVLVGAGAGCNLTAKPFAGTVVQMTLTGPSVSAPGQHFELWGRNAYNDVLRISGIFDYAAPGSDESERLFPFGFAIRPAITMDDPCVIDDEGHLLTKAEAYHDTVVAGVAQSAEEQAQQIRTRIAQLTSTSSCDGSGGDPAWHCGIQASTLLGVVPYELCDANGVMRSVLPPAPRTCETSGGAAGCIPYGAAPSVRLAACRDYWSQSPLAYTPNPTQITAALHGLLYGELRYITTSPPLAFDSIRIDSNVGLRGIAELWITTEADMVDAAHRGPILVDGTPDQGGFDVVHFDLSPPPGTAAAASGTAALLVDLESGPALF
jgi:hypothetical protein